MKPKLVILAGLAGLLCAVALAGGGDSSRSEAAAPPLDQSPPDFTRLLDEAGMTFVVPNGFQETRPRANPLFLYDKAVRAADGRLEMRYAVRPLGRIRVDYDDPHSAAPDPNHMFPLMFQSMVTLLSNGRHSPTREFPPAQAREKFNADWAAAAVFDISPEFAADHRQALVIALHKHQLADAYAIFLFEDYEAVKERINAHMGALAFHP
jgi:hypothetical protein